MLAQLAPSEQMPAQHSSPESHNLPQPDSTQQQAQSQQTLKSAGTQFQQTLKSAGTQGNIQDFLLPPLPESGISALRQQARLTSLHLGEEEGLPIFSGQEEEEQGVDADEGQAGSAAGKASAEVIQIPVELQVTAMMLP
jgi:hypothetical protein